MSTIDPSPAAASLWSQKPWWCQPWSIVLSGISVIAASWFLFHSLWVSALVSVGVAIWWLLFLVLVPAAYGNAVNTNAVNTTEGTSPPADSASVDQDGV